MGICLTVTSSTESNLGLHIACQQQNKVSNTVKRLITPYPEKALLTALSPLPLISWWLHIWPSPLEGAEGKGKQLERNLWWFYWLCLLGVHITGRCTKQSEDKGVRRKLSLLDQIRFSCVLWVSLTRPIGYSQLTEFPINKKWNHSNSTNFENMY